MSISTRNYNLSKQKYHSEISQEISYNMKQGNNHSVLDKIFTYGHKTIPKPCHVTKINLRSHENSTFPITITSLPLKLYPMEAQKPKNNHTTHPQGLTKPKPNETSPNSKSQCQGFSRYTGADHERKVSYPKFR